MKRKIFSAAIFLIFSLNTIAQLKAENTTNNSNQPIKTAPGLLISTLAKAINTTSYLTKHAKQKKSFIVNAEKISDVTVFVKNITSLAGFINPNKFKTGVSAASILNKAGSVSTFTKAGILLKDLEAGLKPEAFSSIWNLSRANWLKDIDRLK